MSFVAAAGLLFAATQTEAFIKCRAPDGDVYFGDRPPPGCSVQREYSDMAPAPLIVGGPESTSPSGGSGEVRTFEDALRDAAYETAMRETVPAVQVIGIYDQVAASAPSVEGKVANGADFPVYNVRVCARGNCRLTQPPTLLPGDHATFDFPTPARTDLKVTWDVHAE